MDQLTNLQLYDIFQESKINKFEKELDLEIVIKTICSKLEIERSEKLFHHVKHLYEEYKSISQTNRTLHSSKRNFEEKNLYIPC